MEISNVVKVIESNGIPVKKKYEGQRGIIKEILEDKSPHITVFFEGIGEDDFCPEQLEVIKVYNFSEYDMSDDWKEHFKAFDFYFAHEMEKSKALPKGLQVGKIFSIGVADGHAYYQVAKIFKTRVHLTWRKDLCPDHYADHHFGCGGSFDRYEVEAHINQTDSLMEFFGSRT